MPAKITWRQISSDNCAELVFQFSLGWFGVVMSLFGGLLPFVIFALEIINFIGGMGPFVITVVRMGDYWAAVFFMALIGLFGSLGAWSLVFGILLLLKRILQINRAANTATVNYLLWSFPVYKRVVNIGHARSVTYKRNWLWLGIDARLNFEMDNRARKFRLITVTRRCADHGSQIARQIAEFLDVPFVSHLT